MDHLPGAGGRALLLSRGRPHDPHLLAGRRVSPVRQVGDNHCFGRLVTRRKWAAVGGWLQ